MLPYITNNGSILIQARPTLVFTGSIPDNSKHYLAADVLGNTMISMERKRRDLGNFTSTCGGA